MTHRAIILLAAFFLTFAAQSSMAEQACATDARIGRLDAQLKGGG